MSVSRVEYDAALKRVRYERHGLADRPCPSDTCDCERLTRAALGLDEPPTDPQPFDVRDYPMAFPSHVDNPGDTMSAPTGWKCPGCGSCYAPHFPKCTTCGPKPSLNPSRPRRTKEERATLLRDYRRVGW